MFPIVISIISLIVSLATLFERLYTNKVSVKCSVIDYLNISEVLQMYVHFENSSRLPIAVTRVNILLENGYIIPAKLEPVMIKSQHIDLFVGKSETTVIKSMPLPAYIQPLGAISGYLEFPNSLNIRLEPDTSLYLEIYTNRGTLVEFLTLGDKGNYLRTG